MQKLVNSAWIDCTQEDLINGDIYRIPVGNGGWQQQTSVEVTPITPEPIRKISTGAMQRRFTIPEEVFITSDAAATVIKSRLLNADHADLDFKDTIEGVTYICGVLLAGGVIVDIDAKITELLRDGEESEKP